MGKNRTIKSLGKIIGNIVIHKILVRHTNIPLSLNHLENEIGAYRDNALETAQEFNWSESDKELIKQEALKKFRKDMINFYKDVKYPEKEVSELIEETVAECLP